MRNATLLLAFGFCSLAFAGSADATIVVGGNFNGRVFSALDTLGLRYTDKSNGKPVIDPAGLGAGDVVILANYNVGTGQMVHADYNNFLNSGGCLIMTGGHVSNHFRTWLSGYFTLDPVAAAAGWQMTRTWKRTVAHPVTQYLPDNYTFSDQVMSSRMIAFKPAAGTTLLGEDSLGASIAAIRTYKNGGAFVYMAFPLGTQLFGTAGDQANFVVPFLKGALEKVSAVPEPSTVAGAILGLLGAGVSAMRRRRVG